MLNKTLQARLYQNWAQLLIHLAWALILAKTTASGFTYTHNAHSKRHFSFSRCPTVFFLCDTWLVLWKKLKKLLLGLLCGMMPLNGGNPSAGPCLGLPPSTGGLYFGNAPLLHYPMLYLPS